MEDSSDNDSAPDHWQPNLYDDKHSFVWKLASSVVDQLNPQAGERILDLGCGTGQLTAQIAESGADATGLDQSPAMIEEARQLYPHIDFQVGDAHDFCIDEPFDAIFSNAALHWIHDPQRVAACLSKSLKPGGRLVVEFGGSGNVFEITRALESASRLFFSDTVGHPWYFPSIADFATLLEQHNIEVTQAAMIDRPTLLDGDDGLRNWVKMFGQHWLSRIDPDKQDAFLNEADAKARETLFRDGAWYADYRRIRVTGVRR